MTRPAEQAPAAVRTHLAEYFPDARIEQRCDGDGTGRLEVVTRVRRYRLLLDPELLRPHSGAGIVARCRAESIAWRRADTTRLLMTRTRSRRPLPHRGR